MGKGLGGATFRPPCRRGASCSAVASSQLDPIMASASKTCASAVLSAAENMSSISDLFQLEHGERAFFVKTIRRTSRIHRTALRDF